LTGGQASAALAGGGQDARTSRWGNESASRAVMWDLSDRVVASATRASSGGLSTTGSQWPGAPRADTFSPPRAMAWRPTAIARRVEIQTSHDSVAASHLAGCLCRQADTAVSGPAAPRHRPMTRTRSSPAPDPSAVGVPGRPSKRALCRDHALHQLVSATVVSYGIGRATKN